MASRLQKAQKSVATLYLVNDPVKSNEDIYSSNKKHF